MASRTVAGSRFVVTGASSGIGREIALELGRHGADVVALARSADKLATLAADFQRLSGRCEIVAGDVTDDGARHACVRRATEAFGGLDVLVNNAGVGAFVNVADMSIEHWQQVIETNLSGVFYCSHAAIPHLRRRGGGWIVNISSLAGKNSFAGGAAYCASKAGLNAFSESLMQEVRYDNIRVSYIMPGSVSTGFAGRGESGEADWKIAPEDVAELVVELLTFPSRSLPSRIELRPSKPKK
jgi:NAD(P)-dependent dehydrogenase (short-subunit alcohol dehydrogenase family)